MTSKISWTEKTWETFLGCSRVSTGCEGCYAERLVGTRFVHNTTLNKTGKYNGLTRSTKQGPRWTGTVVFDDTTLLQPLSWKKPCKVFVNSRSDTFHEENKIEDIAKVFAIMAATPQHTYQIVTKRPERAAEILNDLSFYPKIIQQMCDIDTAHAQKLFEVVLATTRALVGSTEDGKIRPLPNVWVGTSVENQEAAKERIPHLLQVPAAVHWLSIEPLLEEVSILEWIGDIQCARCGWLGFQDNDTPEGGLYKAYPEGKDEETGEILPATQWATEDTDPEGEWVCPKCGDGEEIYHTWEKKHDRHTHIKWIVVGGESGPDSKRRPMQMEWARKLRDECKNAGVAFYYKQDSGRFSNERPYLVEENGAHTTIQEFPL